MPATLAPRRKRKPVASVAPDHPALDPVEAARAANLRYVSDEKPGIRRVRAGKGFRYVDANGHNVTDEATLQRIRALVIPPAWEDVWICPSVNGHIQATGRDARGRKQYRYHHRWRSVRDEAKYDRMVAFAQALPAIRKQVGRDLGREGIPREKVLAALVRLLEKTLIRVGNEEYAQQNGSYGLTTMRDHHVEIDGSVVHFRFKGKSGVNHEIKLTDRRLARIVEECQDLPGRELFQYEDDDGEFKAIDSGDVNDYLREMTGQPFTAKDFRTWAGTVLAARALQAFQEFDSEAAAKRNVVAAITDVAKRLGNTRTVCQKCYVHPTVIASYLDGSLVETLSQEVARELRESLPELPPEEAAVLALLQQRLNKDKDAA